MKLMTGAKAHILDAVGHTPIVKLNRIGAHTRADIYVKCEYLNPGGSMKDRIAIRIVDEAEKSGALKPGGTLVEATSGNTGMGLALVAAVRGYKCVFVMPDKMSEEKVRSLRAVGAKVVMTPTNVEADDPRSVYNVAKRIANETPNAVLSNQYHNPANPEAHYLSTGPEIWEQTQGDFDVFVAGLGTGGTITGVGRYLKETKPSMKVVGVDPVGSLYHKLWQTGVLEKGLKTAWKVEGIGEDFLPSTINLKMIDEIVQVNDEECFFTARDLVKKEGILTGGSAGGAVAGAVKYAEQIGQPLRILVLVPDHFSRYLTKYLDDEWMREHGFLGRDMLGTVEQLIEKRRGPGPVITVSTTDKVRDVIGKMKDNGISQLPVLEGGKLVGIVHETDLLRYLVEGEHKLDSSVGALAQPNFIAVAPDAQIATLPSLVNKGKVVLAIDRGEVLGVISKIDLIEYFAGYFGAV